MHVYSDFDGTITQQDATDFILSRLAKPEWETIEQEWKAGRIGSAECMRLQIELIEASPAKLNATLDEVQIDPGFVAFAQYCEESALQLTVISDGVDYFIRRILSRIGLDHLPVIANQLALTDAGGWRLTSPYSKSTCSSAAGVCKCAVVTKGEEPRIYIGDGQSDFCVSNKPEMVFAKGKLATFCGQNATPYIGYEDFCDVKMSLQRLLNVTHRAPSNIPVFS
jgi:2,3-diketo-5-methylthio-1-phosphopentane phosphatase